MRILHVSDLHLGRGLGELSREAEQRALVQELVAAATDLDVAATILAGDVFDAFTPPAWAEDLFFQLIDGLADGGQRAVLAIAGNHDSGARLAAADPLARRLGIVLAGDVDDVLRGHDAGPRRVRVELSAGTISAFLLVFASLWLLIRLWRVFPVLVASLVVAGTLSPAVRWFEGTRLGRTGGSRSFSPPSPSWPTSPSRTSSRRLP